MIFLTENENSAFDIVILFMLLILSKAFFFASVKFSGTS